MSKHWHPDRTAARPPSFWDWRKPPPPPEPSRRRKTALAIGAAVTIGTIGGGLWSVAEPDAAPAASEAPSVILPVEQVDPADAEWESRGKSGAAEVGSSGARIAFGFCHSGGGSDCVVDGDTFYIGGEKVRIAGIDAPETHPPRCPEEARLGAAATERLQSLLNSGSVTMSSIDRDRDTYGRLLRDVQVDGADVGAAMVAAGVAREYGSGRRSWC